MNRKRRDRFPPPTPPPDEEATGPIRRPSVLELMEDLQLEKSADEVAAMLDGTDGYPTTDVLVAFIYRLAKEHIGWSHLERIINELLEADAHVLLNEPMARHSLKLANLLHDRRKRAK